MDLQSKRQEIKQQQEQWMRERAAHSTRFQLEEGTVSHAQSKSAEQIIDRVTGHLMVKIKQEILEEMKNDTAGQKYERFLAAEIESHTCPICYELMVAPKNAPILLYPCGHSFCKVCVDSHRNSYHKDQCPCCRVKIEAQAPNISLQQLIQNYVGKKQTADIREEFDDQNTDTLLQANQVENEFESVSDNVHHILREMQMKQMRVRVMETELISLKEQQAQNAQRVDMIKCRRDLVSKKLGDIEEEIKKLQYVKNELQQEQRVKSEELDILQTQGKETEERAKLVSNVLSQIQEEISLLELVLNEHEYQSSL
eukprot:TRINITY_DN2022_c0_g2_i1.p2 TRINITY_DN2022_c0_g2~~TRINITY_DN2022_c0_g2_i1.p2  ORF type:complete len:312 (-),score=46.39 TRINITY_DN2022_c0_g2_i1:742-1677(-)